MKSTITACLLAAACVPAAAERTYVMPDYREITPLNMAILAGNCGAALGLMKAGVKKRQPDVLLIGGTMFESGTCVKADWDKAVNLYQLADQAGNPSGVARLMAGFAQPGRDNGLALWWAVKKDGGRSLGINCDVGVNPDDHELFNAALERMAPAVYRGCVYSAGVMGEILAQAYYPALAAQNGLSGTVLMRFSPAKGTIEWEMRDMEERQPGGVRDLAKVELENPREIRRSLLKYLESKAAYALSRYQKPESGLNPTTTLRATFVFQFRD